MASTQHNGSVYKHKSKDIWKETWLSLESDGKLTWKKKDAYEVKGVAYANEILDQIQISGWTAHKCAKYDNVTPFLMRIPIEIRGSKANKTLIVRSGPDLDLWLDAFATVVGKWKLWKTVKQRQASRISRQREGMDERSVEAQLKYEELVEFYRATWAEFLASYKKSDAENGVQINDRIQNGVTTHHVDTPRHINSDHTAAPVKHQHMTNGSAAPNHQASTNPPSYDYAEIATSSAQKQGATTTTTVTVHHHANQVNGLIGSQNKNGQAANNDDIGEEDDGEEMHF